MTPAQLSRAVLRSARELGVAGPLPDRVQLRPRGDGIWGTAIALRLAGAAGLSADDVARGIGERLVAVPGVRGVEVREGGFLQITLAEGHQADLLRELTDGPAPGNPPEQLPEQLPEDPANDAARWAEAAGGPVSLVQRDENPLFRVRYAHARAQALLRGGRALGLAPEPGAAVLAHRSERALLAALGEQVTGGERMARRLLLVADAFLATERERSALPVGDEEPAARHRARLALARAAALVLARGLRELGISAPDHL
ncbi:DALR anticodon-binding domain-containing protein [Streptomyces sp. NBC_01803]|uniref:DALR anticodon-binding domain-containing protein n=1 Tax=Streptomyces sp. NBC_01803 TaxID=2975946 RepID=UPI002DD9EBA9|nr:DALR anticodon-binding domain-containing protein [Streptomyces sp. NBC_01803]WSA44191.1 DALR anticodon-binding domain-containing protein [Streptomyces sp. NBC_01803]